MGRIICDLISEFELLYEYGDDDDDNDDDDDDDRRGRRLCKVK